LTTGEAPLLQVEGLHVASARGDILRGVDLIVERGQVTGIVGESGSGKTTLGLAILGLLGRTRRVTAGSVRLDGDVVVAPDTDRTAALRGSRVTFVPQDPFRSFDPLRRMASQMRRPLQLHHGLGARAADDRVASLLSRLGIDDPGLVMDRYPHELSGGMLQRAAIATALSCDPELVIADEPTTALDAIVQRQVIDAFMALIGDLGTSLLVISHDLRLIGRLADRVAAMYAGRIVEFGPTERLLGVPRHPYPAALLATSVLGVPPGQHLPVIPGQPPTLPGTLAPCAFAPRCPRADTRCWSDEPWYAWPASEGEACHHPVQPGEELELDGEPQTTSREVAA
jgi:oligopeptide/dipeptide ABC transporter ATP-binding protein